MTSAKEKFKAQSQSEKVANQRKGVKEAEQPHELKINTEKAGSLSVPQATTKLQTTPVEVVDQTIKLSSDAAVKSDISGIYDAASTQLSNTANQAIASFEDVARVLTTILSRGVTVDQMSQTIGTLSFEQRKAQLAILDEVENAQVVQSRQLDIADAQVSIETKRLAIQLKAAKGFLRNAITVEEVKDLENQLKTVQKENELKQDGRNIQLNFLAGSNAIAASRVSNKLNFLGKMDEKLIERESDRLNHVDAMSDLHRRLYAATEKGYSAYVQTKENKADAKVTLLQKMKETVKQ